MTCEDFRNRLDRADGTRPRGIDAVAHMARCPACRELATRQATALDLYRAPFAGGERDFVRSVMEVLPFLPKPRREVGLREWAMVGLALAGSSIVAAVSLEAGLAEKAFGTSYVLPLGIVFGLALTAYGLVFIASHLELLAKTFHVRERTP
ncbi:MAG: hypothetical protein KBC36_12610 [Spirochaetia bacterium]|nr:hypothetical protein [Spirochaetia bacterium]